MSSRTGKHFRSDKDLIIHDKTGRVRTVIYLLFYSLVEVPHPVCFHVHSKPDKHFDSCISFLTTWYFLSDFNFLESLCKISERSFRTLLGN